MDETELAAGAIVWVTLDPVRGREQGRHRPCMVVASSGYLESVTTLVMVVPITTVDRSWPNHVAVEGPSGLSRHSWAMPEQARAIARDRITSAAGSVSESCLLEVRMWLRDFLDL